MREYESYEELHRESLDNKSEFWLQEAERIQWVNKPQTGLDATGAPFYKWFSDGRLNITESCLDRHAKSCPDKIAFFYESPIAKERCQVTYAQLLARVERLAHVLKERGLLLGDRVVLYMPMIIETAVAMLACARLGLVHCVVFGGFSARELGSRIRNSAAKCIISASCGLEPHKIVDYPQMVREAKLISTPDLCTIYVNRTQRPLDRLQKNEFLYQELMKDAG